VNAGESEASCIHFLVTWPNYWLATALGIASSATILLLIQNRRWRQTVIAARQQQATTAHAARLALAGEITASIVHELSQPLAAILSNVEAAELLIQKQPPRLDEIRQILADVHLDDLRAGKIVRHLRSFLSKRELQLEDADVNAIAATVLQLIQREAARRHIVVRTVLHPSLPTVRADPAHLQQVLLNLFLNAMDAMAPVPTNTRLLELRTSMLDAKSILVAVTDTGCGLAEEQLPTLFNSFVTAKPEGMGLGLSIARAIIQAHHGAIWAEAAASGGAVFKFTLPIKSE
jgi:C4-dicarboxylate-specific signal transduction histidine kinase